MYSKSTSFDGLSPVAARTLDSIVEMLIFNLVVVVGGRKEQKISMQIDLQ